MSDLPYPLAVIRQKRQPAGATLGSDPTGASSMQPHDILPDHQNDVQVNGVTVRKGSVGAFLASVREDRKSTRLLQSQSNLVCRLLLEKKKKKQIRARAINKQR